MVLPLQRLWADDDSVRRVQDVDLLHGSRSAKRVPRVGCSDKQPRLRFLLQLLLHKGEEADEGMFIQRILASEIDTASLAEDEEAVTPSQEDSPLPI